MSMKDKVGLCVHLPDVLMRQYIKDLGIKWIRCDFNWDILQPRLNTPFDFRQTDEIVEFCKQEGIKILANVGYTPDWANAYKGKNYLPSLQGWWEGFIATVVWRYRKDIFYWGIWNEPNVPQFFNEGREKYFSILVKPAYEIIKAINSQAKVVAPGVITSVSRGWNKWLRTAYDYRDYFDIASFHAYTYPAENVIKWYWVGKWPSWATRYDSILKYFFPQHQAIDNLISKLDKPIWLEETGWSTTHCTELEQRNNYEEMLEHLRWSHWGFEKVFFYQLVDDPMFTDERFGILRTDFSKRPAYHVLEHYLKNS